MTAAILATAAVVAVAFAVRLVVGRSRHGDEAGASNDADASVESWTDPRSRSRPDDLELDRFGLAPPRQGTLLGVVFTHPACESCQPLTRRITGIDEVVAAVVDVTDAPAVVRSSGVTSVPTLVLVDHDGAVVRSWIGTPLAGAVEETVRRALGA